MQWHGQDRIGTVQGLAAGHDHPAGELADHFTPAAVLETEHQRTGRIVVRKRGAGEVEDGHSGDAGGAECGTR